MKGAKSARGGMKALEFSRKRRKALVGKKANHGLEDEATPARDAGSEELSWRESEEALEDPSCEDEAGREEARMGSLDGADQDEAEDAGHLRDEEQEGDGLPETHVAGLASPGSDSERSEEKSFSGEEHDAPPPRKPRRIASSAVSEPSSKLEETDAPTTQANGDLNGHGSREASEQPANCREPDKASDKTRKKGPLPKPKATNPKPKPAHKTGVCYLSRIPPHMKPLKLRHLLSAFAPVGRIYLAPEDASVRLKRKQEGGNRGKNFTEGWVEFERKRDAKHLSQMLNGQPVGGGHRSAYRFDLWNIKYLSGFKWDNLTEEIAYRNAVREQKLAAELRTAAKERDYYLQQVNRSKGFQAMEKKRQKRQQTQSLESESAQKLASKEQETMVRRSFIQRGPIPIPGGQGVPSLSSDVLSKVFG